MSTETVAEKGTAQRQLKVDWMERFDPNKPKRTIDDIRERVRQRYVLYQPQIEILMAAYDDLLKMYNALHSPSLLREIDQRRKALTQLRKAYKKATTPKEEKKAIKEVEAVARVFDEGKKCQN